MSCPYEKETSFGRDRGYLVCTNPAKRMRHCDPDACRMENEKGDAPAEKEPELECAEFNLF